MEMTCAKETAGCFRIKEEVRGSAEVGNRKPFEADEPLFEVERPLEVMVVELLEAEHCEEVTVLVWWDLAVPLVFEQIVRSKRSRQYVLAAGVSSKHLQTNWFQFHKTK